jgi:L-threonylcarbamoyladenylate synthase
MRSEFQPQAFVNQKIGLISFSALSENEHLFTKCVVLSDDNNLEEVAESLFAALRELDKNGLDLIVVDTCPAQGLGAAIMDKITRATARTRY